MTPDSNEVKPGEMVRVKKHTVVGGTPSVQMLQGGEVVLILDRREKTPLDSFDVLLPNGMVGWLCETDIACVVD
jgi:hypothetical protein